MNEDDVGDYEAIASNKIGQSIAKFLLVVDEGPQDHYAPQFISPLNNQVFKKTTRVDTVCFFGFPRFRFFIVE